MKTLTLFTTLLTTTLAAPALDERSCKCPSNTAQPDGKLPKDAISTSALVSISASNPDHAYPNSSWAKITPNDFCTVFNLELPSDATQGKICNLVFDFPSLPLAPSPFTFDGPGHFTFTGYAINAGAIPGVTTYNKQPAPGLSPPFPPEVISPGMSYVVNSAPYGIPPYIGTVTVSGSLCSDDTTLLFRQGEGVCPMGFYVVLTDEADGGVPQMRWL